MYKSFGSKALAVLLSLCMTLSMLAGTFTVYVYRRGREYYGIC